MPRDSLPVHKKAEPAVRIEPQNDSAWHEDQGSLQKRPEKRLRNETGMHHKKSGLRWDCGARCAIDLCSEAGKPEERGPEKDGQKMENGSAAE